MQGELESHKMYIRKAFGVYQQAHPPDKGRVYINKHTYRYIYLAVCLLQWTNK